MFSVVAGVLLRPLPYREAAHLVSLWQWDQGRSGAPDANARQSVSPANFRDYVSDNRAFDGLAGYVRTSRILTRSGPAEQLLGESVTWNYFGVLGIQPALGRTFTPEEDRRNTSRVVVCAESLWRSRFAADPNILGRQIVLDGERSVSWDDLRQRLR